MMFSPPQVHVGLECAKVLNVETCLHAQSMERQCSLRVHCTRRGPASSFVTAASASWEIDAVMHTVLTSCDPTKVQHPHRIPLLLMHLQSHVSSKLSCLYMCRPCPFYTQIECPAWLYLYAIERRHILTNLVRLRLNADRLMVTTATADGCVCLVCM